MTHVDCFQNSILNSYKDALMLQNANSVSCDRDSFTQLILIGNLLGSLSDNLNLTAKQIV